MAGTRALGADAGIEAARCGSAAGVEYQQLVQKTGGLRGSLCSRGAVEAFADALVDRIAGSGPKPQCSIAAPFPIRTAKAVSADGRLWKWLDPTYDASTCGQSTQRYFQASGLLTLCPAACAQLTAEGLTALLIAERCGR